MDEAWRERGRERAYGIWQREGCPDGHAEQFWLMAEEELLEEGRGQPGAQPEAAAADEPPQVTSRSSARRTRAAGTTGGAPKAAAATGKASKSPASPGPG